VKWLIQRPAMTRMQDFSQTEAIAAARLLWIIAPSSGDPQAVQGLAQALADIAVRFGRGKAATPKDCRVTLGKVKLRIGSAQYKLGIRNLKEIESKFADELELPADFVEYRSEAGNVMGILKKRVKKAPENDFSYRIRVAVDALRESKCSTPLATLAEILSDWQNEHWNSQRVQKRCNANKMSVSEAWPATIWKERFWYTLDSTNRDKPMPEKQPFILKWNG
jgi:hypothetical protein